MTKYDRCHDLITVCSEAASVVKVATDLATMIAGELPEEPPMIP